MVKSLEVTMDNFFKNKLYIWTYEKIKSKKKKLEVIQDEESRKD